jgi:hypothetical protein
MSTVTIPVAAIPVAEGALSDAVLQAARAAVAAFPGNPYQGNPWAGCGAKNPPLLTLLDALIDAATATAAAIADNAWDDCQPIPADRAKAMADALHRCADTIAAAAAAPDARGWSLPSCSGKELV